MARTARKSRSCKRRASALSVTRNKTWSSASLNFLRASSADDVRVGLRAGSVSVVARCKGGRTQRALTARRNARASTRVEAPSSCINWGTHATASVLGGGTRRATASAQARQQTSATASRRSPGAALVPTAAAARLAARAKAA